MINREKVIEMLSLLNTWPTEHWDTFSIEQLAALLTSDVKELIKDMKAEDKNERSS
jgi:hypothetical protein